MKEECIVSATFEISDDEIVRGFPVLDYNVNDLEMLEEVTSILNKMIATGQRVMGRKVIGYEVGFRANTEEEC